MSKSIVSDQFDYLFKLVVIGGILYPDKDSGVGKTNLLSRFSNNQFSQQSKPTIGVQFATKSLQIQNQKIKSQIWDTAGQQRFRAITQAYYKGASGALIVFDITRRSSYDNLPKWIKQLKQNSNENLAVILVGNKSDLTQLRCIRQQQVSEFAQQNKLFYIQTSALDSSNVQKAFMVVIKQIYHQTVKKEKIISGQEKVNVKHPIQKPINIQKNVNINQPGNQKKKKCCE